MQSIIPAYATPEDLLEFLFRSIPSLAVSILSCTAVAFIVALLIAKKVLRRNLIVLLAISLAPLLIWTIYFSLTARWRFTLTLLNSEDDQVAESAYKMRFMDEVGNLEQAVNLVVKERKGEPNFRFYAACRVADFLRNSRDKSVVAKTLNIVDNAPIIETGFFGTNGLNYRFYTPGHEQVRIPVRSLIEKMLNDNGQDSSATNSRS